MISKLIYRLLKPLFLKYYFNEQSKKDGFESMGKSFIDSNGKQYYSTINDFDMPYERTKALEKAVMRLRSGLSEEEHDLILDTIEKALNSGKKSELAVIGHCVIEMRKRKDLLLHPEIMFDIAALRYIREDEKPYIVDPEIHRQKVKQFIKDSEGGLYDFFYKAGLSKFIPYLEKLEIDWDEHILNSRIKTQALAIHLKAYITGSTL